MTEKSENKNSSSKYENLKVNVKPKVARNAYFFGELMMLENSMEQLHEVLSALREGDERFARYKEAETE